MQYRSNRRRLVPIALLLQLILALACAGALPVSPSGHSAQAGFDLDRNRQSVVSLDGLWRFQPGDNPQWANPAFDDSAWPQLRSDQSWSAQGYPNLSGYGWYRFTIQLPAHAPPSSMLLVPIYTCYEVYAEGRLIGASGVMPPHLAPYAMFQFQQFPVTVAPNPAARTLHIAIRAWHSDIWASYIGGGPSRSGNLFGERSLIATELRHRQNSQRFLFVDDYVYSIAGLLVGLTILGLFCFRPREHEYLWCAVLLLSLALDSAFQIAYNLSSFLPVPIFDLLDGLLIAANLAAALAFFSIVLRARRNLVWRTTLALALASPILVILYWPGWLSVAASAALQLLCWLPSSIWVLAVLFRRAVRRDLDAWLLLIPTGLYMGFGFVFNLALLLSQAGWLAMPDILLEPLPLPPFTIHWAILFDLIFLAALLAFLIRRFTQARQREERYAGQLEAARQVQQILLPEAIARVPGFVLDCVYHPAEEVGGDFFQILPATASMCPGDLLVVIGDVAGKGLPAAMMVSVLVGAIHAEAAHTCDPAAMLASLNERTVGRTHGGFTTCLCLHITARGEVTVASAGHLSPYRDGLEVELWPALPLGILPRLEYETTSFQLQPGERLTIVSDGVLEAQSRSGELLGFDRTRELSSRPAAEIAAAAQDFGQNDDITVVTIQFEGSLAEVRAQLAMQGQAKS